MQWVTSAMIHYDRVASAWLIKRFVDPDAVFVFLRKGEAAAAIAPAATPFGLPGVELGVQDANQTTFDRILAKYAIDDAGLRAMARLIRLGVDHILHNAPLGNDRLGSILPGIMAVCEGIMLSQATDAKVVETVLPVFDGLLSVLKAEALRAQRNEEIPAEGVGEGTWRTMFFTALSMRARATGCGYTGQSAFERDEDLDKLLGGFRALLEKSPKQA